MLFRKAGVESLTTNQLVIRIQPDEGISLRFGAKVPGPTMQQAPVEMDFSYADYFGAAPSTGYERLLYDCMIGDQTLFQRADMVEAGWTHHPAGARRVAGAGAACVPELRGRLVGPEGIRRAARARRAHVAEERQLGRGYGGRRGLDRRTTR